MSTVEAVKQYFSKDTERPVTMRELLEFFKGMPKEEKEYYGQAACKALGVEWTPSN